MGGNSSSIIFGVAIAVVAALLIFGIRSYHRKKAFSEQELISPLTEPDKAQPLYMRCTGGEFAGMQIPLTSQVAIGRAGACQLVYASHAEGISATHCIVRMRGDRAELTDMASTCGTFVHGERIAPNAPVTLAPGDSFYIGKPENNFVITRQN